MNHHISTDLIKKHNTKIYIFALYLILSIGFTWPVIAHLDRVNLFWGSSPFDKLIYLWNFDWMKEAITQGKSPFTTDRLFYPETRSLGLYTPTYVYALCSLPIQWIWPGERGLYIAFHLFFILSFALSGFGVYAFSRALGCSRSGAFLAGVIFAFCSQRMTNLARLNILSTEMIPFFFLGLHKSFQRPGLFAPLATALCAAILFYNTPPHAIGIVLSSVVFLPFCWAHRQSGWMKRIIIMGMLSLFFVAPLVPGLNQARLEGASEMEYDADEVISYSLDLTAPFWPNENDLLLGFLPILRPVNFLEEGYSFFLGLPIFLLLGIAIKKRRAFLPSRMLWLMSVFFFVFALGPYLKIWEHHTKVPLPYLPLSHLFSPLRVTRTPARFFLFGWFALSVLAGFGMEVLRKRVDQIPRTTKISQKIPPAWLLYGCFCWFIMLDGLERFPLARTQAFDPKIPSLYQKLAEMPEDFGILDLPYDTHHTRRFSMFYQIVHGKGILYADYPRTSRRNVLNFSQSKLFTLLIDEKRPAQELSAELLDLDLIEERNRLYRMGIGAIVLHAQMFNALFGESSPEAIHAAERESVIAQALSTAWGKEMHLDFGFYEGIAFFTFPDVPWPDK